MQHLLYSMLDDGTWPRPASFWFPSEGDGLPPRGASPQTIPQRYAKLFNPPSLPAFFEPSRRFFATEHVPCAPSPLRYAYKRVRLLRFASFVNVAIFLLSCPDFCIFSTHFADFTLKIASKQQKMMCNCRKSHFFFLTLPADKCACA